MMSAYWSEGIAVNDSNPNPYEVSAECTGGSFAMDGVAAGGFGIDGHQIVCGSSVALPPICILTGAGDDVVQITAVAQFGSWKLVIRNHQVRCACFVQRAIYDRRRVLRQIGTALCVLGIAGMVGLPFLFVDTAGSGPTFALCFFGGLLTLVAGSILSRHSEIRLTIARHRAGQYWVRGLHPAFFSALQALILDVQPKAK
jgi:hypothetical protein